MALLFNMVTHTWDSKTHYTDEEIIKYIESLDEATLKKTLEYVETKYCDKPNCLLKAVQTGKFKIATILFDLGSSVKLHILWEILINSFNSHIEEKDPENFRLGIELFKKIILKHEYKNVEPLTNIMHIAIRFQTTEILEFLIDREFDINSRYEGLTPIMSCILHNHLNINMIDCLIQHGADLSLVAQDDNCAGHLIGYQKINKAYYIGSGLPKLDGKKIKGKNFMEIVKIYYNFLYENNLLCDDSHHKIYDILKYLEIDYEMTTHECPVCLRDVKELEILSCMHKVCYQCICRLQTRDFIIICPICRYEHDLNIHAYFSHIYLKSCFNNDIIIDCYENKTTVKELVECVEKIVGNQFISIYCNEKKLMKEDTRILSDVRIYDRSSVSYTQRLPHQFTEEYKKLFENGYKIRIGKNISDKFVIL